MLSLITSVLVGMTLVMNQPADGSRISEYPKLQSAIRMQDAGGVQIETTHELLQALKELNLWEAEAAATVPPVIFAGFPKNFHKLADLSTRKKAFLHTLLPTALVALREVQHEREKLQGILQKIGNSPARLTFADGEDQEYRSRLSDTETLFVKRLIKKYRTADADELLKRVDVVPVSLILGQGAIESSWGGSRFARAANNLFGIWTWGERGIVPARRDEGKSHKVKIYDTILDSVRGYILTLNRLGAYRHLRELRRTSNDSMKLAEGLRYYSERRDAYVRDVRQIIRVNNLQRYDTVSLAGSAWRSVVGSNTYSAPQQSTL